MKILVACEESQVVTIAFRNKGHEAHSCDIENCSGGHPEWHLKEDVVPLLNQSWDMVIAFPPCTHLCSSGARWFKEKQKDGRQQQAIDFFMEFVNCKCDKVAVENPVGIMSSKYRKPDQIIQPWMFGHGETKSTCLWLKGLPKLVPLIIQRPINVKQSVWREAPSPERKVNRARTFQGIADAMAEQWGNLEQIRLQQEK